MGLDDACNTCLVLGLGFTTTPENPPKTSKKPPHTVAPATDFETFLTLGQSDETYKVTETKMVDVNKAGGCLHHRHHEEPHASVPAAAGDLCWSASPDTSGVKRERDVSSEEEDDGVNARKKLRLTKEQSALLEESFKQHSALNPNQKLSLARQLSLKPRQVEVWFQNRRARTKLKQTEVDCEFLKRCCETLRNENRRLQKELQELKALEMGYTNMPAATLTVCPSCERSGGGGSLNIKPFSMPSKPRLYNHVTNPSAAC